MGWWPWSSKEETAQKNLQNHIDGLNAEVKTLSALNLKDNNWAKQAIIALGNLNITLQALIENKETSQAEKPPEVKSDSADDLINGGTRKKRKNKKHKKKTYRH